MLLRRHNTIDFGSRHDHSGARTNLAILAIRTGTTRCDYTVQVVIDSDLLLSSHVLAYPIELRE